MRILYLTTGCFDKGGISRYCRYQIQALRDIAGSANVRAMSVLGPDERSFEEPFEVRYFAGGTRPLDKLRFSVRALAEALAPRPDVIWSAHVNLSGLACSLARLCGARSVLNTYGLEVWSGFRRDAAWGLERTDHVLADCHFTARYLEEQGLRGSGSVRVVWDCVDAERFSVAEARPEVLAQYGIPDPHTGINLLTLGRLSQAAAHKGYFRLLQAFGRVAARVPELRLIYAGRGELADRLREQARAAGLEARVFFTGGVHEDHLPDVYRASHMFSLVSERGKGGGEGIPLTPLEAAACGVPILVGNQDGSQEAPEHGVTGYVLDSFDLEGHAAAIERLAVDAALRERMGQAARRRAEQTFAYPLFRQKHRELCGHWALGST